MKKFALLALVIFMILIVLLLIKESQQKISIAKTYEVNSDVMSPALKLGAVYAVDISPVTISNLKRGDIVVYQRGGGEAVDRLLGLPQETLVIKIRQIFINGKSVVWPYVSNWRISDTISPVTLNSNQLVVIPDVSRQGDDISSRIIDRSSIVGKIIKCLKNCN